MNFITNTQTSSNASPAIDKVFYTAYSNSGRESATNSITNSVNSTTNSITNSINSTTNSINFYPSFSSEPTSIKIERQPLQAAGPKRCCICFQSFENADSSDAFRMHLLAHLEPYRAKSVCPNCRIDCGEHDKMVDHLLMVHGGVEKLVCQYHSCIRSFRTKRTLEMHMGKH